MGLVFASIRSTDSAYFAHLWPPKTVFAFVWYFSSEKKTHWVFKYSYDIFKFYLISMNNFYLIQYPYF